MKKTITILSAAAALAAATSCDNVMKIKHLPYPDTAMDTTVVDDYFGTRVADPYRWLEDDNSPETAAWVAAENAVTQNYLAQIPFRDKILARLETLWNYPKQGLPEKAGDKYYYFRNNGLQNQSVLYCQKDVNNYEAEVFLDPNTLSDDGTVALAATAFSKDGRYMAYSAAAAGSDWVKIYVMDTETRQLLPEVIEWVKFSGASWSPDSKGFYYSRYDAPVAGNELSGKNEYQKVYYHTLGQSQNEDVLVFQDLRNPLRYYSGFASDDNRYEFVLGSEGTSGNELLYREVGSKGAFRTLFKGFDYDYTIIDTKDDAAYVLTNDGAPNFRLVKVDLKNPAAGAVDVIAESDDLLENVSSAGGYLMATYLKDATNRVYQCDYDGKHVREVELATLGTAGGFWGEKEDTEVFYSLSNFITPPAIYRYNLADGTSTLFRQSDVAYNPDDFEAEQIFFASKDGTQVPMFVVHRKGLKLDGQNPCYLYGYGGFNISLTPGFSPTSIMFMEQGGVYVHVCLRGGGEYGEKWHKAGMLANKQNVFDDFIGAAEYLIEKGYTSREKLAIAGGSNGGLLVGACMVQRPDLYAVALPAVGVLDMLRFHKFTVGWGWAVEYGSSDNEEQFEYIYKYSPLHNIVAGTCYPATLITTGDHDDRVVPAHSFKFAATLQKAQGCDKPVLIRVETNAGHGAGKPTSKRLAEAADTYAFIFQNTHTPYKEIR